MDRACRVLFVARSFPPEGGSSVQRPVKCVKYLPSFGVEPLVLTADAFTPQRDRTLLEEIPSSVKVFRAFSPEPSHLKERLNGRFNGNGFTGLALRALLKLFSFVYYRAAVVDWSIGWLPFAVRRGLEIIRSEKIDVIYAHTSPPTTLLVGLALKKKTGLPLVIDYADPWTTDPFYPDGTWLRRVNKRLCALLEKECLGAADRVIYCKRSIIDSLQSSFPGLDAGKFVQITNGYDPEDFPAAGTHGNTRPVRIVYTGKLTNRYCYSPRSFFSALKSLLDDGSLCAGGIEVVMAGIASPEHLRLIEGEGLRDIVRHVGYLDHEDSVGLLQSADAFLLIIESPKGPEASKAYAGSLPAKIFEYLYAGKPVLGIVPPGPEAEILQKSRVGFIAAPNDPGSVRAALSDLLNALRKEQPVIDPDWDFIRSFDRKNLVARLASEVHGLAGRGHGRRGTEACTPI